MGMKPSDNCLTLIKESEGLERRFPDGNIGAYLDPVGVWTIGYGSIFNIDEKRPVEQGDVITKADALRWLDVEINEKANTVDSLCTVPLTQGMFDALVSFAYNFGTGNQGLKGSTLLKKLNSKDYEGAANEFGRWIHGDGRVLPGLVTRRRNEEALFRRDGFPNGSIGSRANNPGDVPSTKAYQLVELPLEITRTLEDGSIGEDCYILNCALAELGFLATGTQPNSYTPVTREAVIWFQSQNNLDVDGKFGSKTKTALTTAINKARTRVPDPMLGRAYCRLTRTFKTDSDGLMQLLLEFVSPQGNILDSLDVISGAPGHQSFRVPGDPDSFPGSLQPIPQARYTIADIMWADGRDNYNAEHFHPTNGIGPVFVPLIKTQNDDRDAFGFHMDWNKSGSPGSAGCVCVNTLGDLKKLVALLRLYDPRDLFVNWDLR